MIKTEPQKSKNSVKIEEIAELLIENSVTGHDELKNIASGREEDREDEMLSAALTQLSKEEIENIGIYSITSNKGERLYTFGKDKGIFSIKVKKENGRLTADPCCHIGDMMVVVSSVREAIDWGSK